MFSSRREWAAFRRMGMRMHRLADRGRRSAGRERQGAAHHEHRPETGPQPPDEVSLEDAERLLHERFLEVKESDASWARLSGNLPAGMVQRVCRQIPGIYYVGTTEHNIHIIEKRE